jgi:CHAT domain-containing protein
MDDQLEQWLADEIPPDLLLTPLPDDVAKVVVDRLKQEAERLWSSIPNRSIELADRIIAIGQARGDARQTALGLMSRGDYLKFIGDMREAWDLLEKAGNMYLAAGDEVGWARTRIGRLYLGPKLDCIPTTLVDAKQARAIFNRHGESDRIVRLDLQTALVYNYLGEQHRALELMTAALTLAKTLGEAGEPHIGPLYTNMGLAYYALGDFRQALACYEHARELMAARNETLNVATVEADIAEIAQAQGHYRRALTLLHGVMEHTADESPFETAMTRQHMVECYLSLNRYAEARDLARQVIRDCRTFNAAYELARNLLHLATAEAALANLDSAQEALAEAESIFTSLDATTWVATIRLWRGRMALKQGDASSTYQDAIAAGACFEADGQQVHDAEATLLQGQALFALNEIDAAAQAGHKALRIAQSYNVPSLRYAAHLLLGQIAEAQDANVRAIRYYKAAASTIERVQRGLTITLRSGFLEDKGEAMRALIALHLRSGDIGSALETLERAKSQVWLGYLINREHLRWSLDEAQSLALIEELDRLRAEHQWFYRLAHNPSKESGGPVATQLEQALFEVIVRERRMRAITDQLYLHTGDQWDNQAPIFSLGEIQQGLEDGTLLVEYYCDGDQWWAFMLDKQSVRVHRLPLTVENLSQIMRLTRNNFLSALELGPDAPNARALTQQARKMLQRLYDMLIEPLAIEKNDPQKLIIVPYGALHALPFQLLYNGSNYLIERCEVLILPAAGLSARKGPRRAPGALVLAHSSDGGLLHVHREAEFVHETFGGELFMDKGVKRSVLQQTPTQILHIAAHGEHRLDQPDLSYLQFDDGQLYADDVLQQDLSYELVTLSACETGQANVAADEELIGLGRGFLYAGAGALILSLWGVADDSTTELMKRMYDALSKGRSKAASLREAQTSMLAWNRNLHPAYWGAFQLIGDDSPLSKSGLNQII